MSVMLSNTNIFVTFKAQRLNRKNVWTSIFLVFSKTMFPQNVSANAKIDTENTTMCAPLAGMVADERRMAALTSRIIPNQY